MSGLSAGRRRRRIYARKFDWLEARARHAAGETMAAIAKSYGVNQKAVYRVIGMPEHAVQTATPEQVESLTRFQVHQDACPRCERPKTKKSDLCRDCFNETRLDDATTLVMVPGETRVVLADVAPGRIVRVGSRWGVAMRTTRPKRRLVDFWDGGREWVSDVVIVEVAPGTRVLVGGVEEQPEEIAA